MKYNFTQNPLYNKKGYKTEQDVSNSIHHFVECAPTADWLATWMPKFIIKNKFNIFTIDSTCFENEDYALVEIYFFIDGYVNLYIDLYVPHNNNISSEKERKKEEKFIKMQCTGSLLFNNKIFATFAKFFYLSFPTPEDEQLRELAEFMDEILRVF